MESALLGVVLGVNHDIVEAVWASRCPYIIRHFRMHVTFFADDVDNGIPYVCVSFSTVWPHISDTRNMLIDDSEVKYSSLQYWAKIAPLLAALIAPITSLLDIPALTVCKIPSLNMSRWTSLSQQHWYARYGVPQPDFTASVVLSAVGLAFNLLANALLVLRFSATATYWHVATVLSSLCWLLKVSILAATLTQPVLKRTIDPNSSCKTLSRF